MPAGVRESTVSGGESPPETVYVWDRFVRIFHWGLAASFAIAWLTADEWDQVHEWAGYAALALVALRFVWGFVGTKNARFADFVRSPWTSFAHLSEMLRGRERRHVGHNPVGGMMILALMAGIFGLGVTGWMMTLDAPGGAEWLEEAHEILANLLLVLVGLHVAGVAYGSLRHNENLIFAMLTGRKRRV